MHRSFGPLLAATTIATAALLSTAPGSAYSLVEKQSDCTRYGGKVSRAKKDDLNPDYPKNIYRCDTPARDRQCVRKHGEDWYFDAEFGKCMEDDYCDDLFDDDCW